MHLLLPCSVYKVHRFLQSNYQFSPQMSIVQLQKVVQSSPRQKVHFTLLCLGSKNRGQLDAVAISFRIYIHICTNHEINLRTRKKINFYFIYFFLSCVTLSRRPASAKPKWLIAKCFLLSSCAPPITGVASICLKVIEQVTDGYPLLRLKKLISLGKYWYCT